MQGMNSMISRYDLYGTSQLYFVWWDYWRGTGTKPTYQLEDGSSASVPLSGIFLESYVSSFTQFSCFLGQGREEHKYLAPLLMAFYTDNNSLTGALRTFPSKSCTSFLLDSYFCFFFLDSHFSQKAWLGDWCRHCRPLRRLFRRRLAS